MPLLKEVVEGFEKSLKQINLFKNDVLFFFCSFVLATFLPRIWLFLSRGIPLDLVVLCMLASDLLVCFLLAAIVCVMRGPKSRNLVFVALYFAYVVFTLANIEHFLAMGSAIPLSDLGFAFRREIHGMSLANVQIPKWLLAVSFTPLIFSIFILLRGLKFSIGMDRRRISLCLSVALLFLVFTSLLSWAFPYAKRVHLNVFSKVVADLLDESLFSQARAHDKMDIPDKYKRKLDLNGRWNLAQSGQRGRNILLILMESVPGFSIGRYPKGLDKKSNGYMPRLSSWAEKNARIYSNFLGHQRRTNRGTVSILCGIYPNFLSIYSKLDFVESFLRSERLICLPEYLRNSSYSTMYIQAAHLGFMNKDLAIPALGFQETIGRDQFRTYQKNYTWGVSDEGLFEEVEKHVETLSESEDPWFVTTLNVGTHYPFEIPKSFEVKKNLSPFAGAVDHLDFVVSSFLERLEKKGLLRNTLVIITADESAGSMQDSDLFLSQNWIPLIVSGPGIPRGEIDEMFSQSDLYLSILDYLGSKNIEAMPEGRSIFRSYDEFRPQLFGNILQREVGIFDSNTEATVCSLNGLGCAMSLSRGSRLLGQLKSEFGSIDVGGREDLIKNLGEYYDFFPSDRDLKHAGHPLEFVRGAQPGWLIEVFEDKLLKTRKRTLIVDSISFDWRREGFSGSKKIDDWGLRFHGCINLHEPAELNFALGADDGAKLFIDGTPTIGRFESLGYTLEVLNIKLDAGSHYLRVDYFDDRNLATLDLKLGFFGAVPIEIPEYVISPPRLTEHGYSCE